MAPPDQLPILPDPPPQRGGALAIRRPGALSTDLLQRGPDQDASPDDEIDLKAIFRALLKHKALIAGVTGFCVLASVVYTLRVKPQYESTVMLQIDRAAQKVVGFNAEMQVDEGPASDQLQLRTQIELLKSRALAERVIDELGLFKKAVPSELPSLVTDSAKGETPEAFGGEAPEQEPGFFETIKNNLVQLFKPSVDSEDALTRAETLKEFDKSLTIEPVRNSRLVELKVLNNDADLSARIANTMARDFIAMSIERKADSSVYARQFLEDQIKQTKAKLEESERLINDYAKKNEILNLGGDRGNATTQTFVDFSAALSKAEQDRIKAESLYNELKNNPENAPDVLENRAIQTYKEQKAKLEAEYAKNLAIFKPDFPAMVQAKAQITELDARIKAEVDTILGSLKAQYQAAKKQEDSLRSKVASTRSEVLTVQDRNVDLSLLKREADTNRQVYDSLLQRLKEVSVTAGITTNNVSIVDEASVPLFPAKPKPLINLGLGLILGLFLGMLAALLREQMDDSIKHADEVEKEFGLPLLGLIPYTKPDKGMEESVAMLAHGDPRSAFAEAYRSMRTALQFSTGEGAPRRFMVTSCGKSEGKSTTALALSINFAQLGQRVLLIDADMRKPSVHKSLLMPNERGLSNLLTGDMHGNEILIQPTRVPNLSVLTAGPTPPDPVELLMGPKFGMLLEKAQELGFTQVVIDGPPLLGIADAVVLGNQIQHIVFAIKAGETKKASIKDALRRLRHAGLLPMGVALTHARNEHTADYAYEAYYGYGNEPASAAAALPPVSAPRQEPSLNRTGGQSGQGNSGFGSGGGRSPFASSSHAYQRPTPWFRKPLVIGGVAGAVVLLGALAWLLTPSPKPTEIAAQNGAKGVVQNAPALATPPSVSPSAATAPEPAPAAPAPAAEPEPAPVAAAPAAPPPGPAPALASLKDGPADTWPALAQLWGASFNPNGACDNAIASGLQCFRLPAGTVAELRVLDRPGLVQLKDGATQRWVLLKALDGANATLVSGANTWQLPVAAFEKQWTGGYSTIWRLPPGHRQRVFAAKANDGAGKWLDEQLKTLQKQQKLAASGDSFEARVRQFQTQYGMPADGKALPSVFVLVNRMVNADEPHLASGG